MNVLFCPDCGTTIPERSLACPSCAALVHKVRLGEIAREAAVAPSPSDALALWREALDLLPPESRQYAQVEERMAGLSRAVDAPVAPARPDFARWGGGIGAVLLVLWKFKTILLLSLGKLKFLAMGLAKLPTLLTMFASFGVYAMLWGWQFAAGFVLCIYVHEIGHVVALRQFGIAATAPMFIPGFGALVRLKQYPSTPREDARVGIAGPVWGAFASAAAMAIGIAMDSAMMEAIGATSAMINLFNLVPIGSLDGGRAYRGMTRVQRLVVAAIFGGSWMLLHTPMTMIVGLVLAGRAAIWKDEPAEGDRQTAITFGVLGVVLTWIGGRMPIV